MTKSAKIKPDRTIRLADLPSDSLLARIAAAMIARHDFYTFTDTSDGAKVLVTR